MTKPNPLITYGLFPITFIAAMAFAFYGVAAGINEVTIIVSISIVVMSITYIFERIQPRYAKWGKSQNDVKTDIYHLVISMVILPKILEAVLKASLLVVALKVSSMIRSDIWPTEWPIIFQLALALVVSQFGEYWVHRAMHEVPFLWRFHAIHHSPKRLYWLNAARFHPIDTAVGYCVATSSLLIAGVPDNILIIFTAWVTVHGLFQHCNIDIKLGPLNYIFSMAELHRWHHSLKLEEANNNYGNNIIFWDIVFGTLYYPKDKQASEDIGLHNIEEFPQNYLQQLMAPFRWKTLTQQSATKQEPATEETQP